MISSNHMTEPAFSDYERVNLCVALSADPDGLDLPFDDIVTLRFFFNLGVQRARTVTAAARSRNTGNPLLILSSPVAGQSSTSFFPEHECLLSEIAIPSLTSVGLDTPPASSSFFSATTIHRPQAVSHFALRPHIAVNPIFSLSECRFTRAFRLQARVDPHFAETESRRRLRSSANGLPHGDDTVAAASDGRDESSQNNSNDEHQGTAGGAEKETMRLAPELMVDYLNSWLDRARKSLQHQGTPVSTVDANGLQVDFSSRPIDSIFQLARAQREQERWHFSLARSTYDSRSKSCRRGVENK